MSVLVGRPRPRVQGHPPLAGGGTGPLDLSVLRGSSERVGRARAGGPRHRRRLAVTERLIPAGVLTVLAALVGLTVWVLINAGHAT